MDAERLSLHASVRRLCILDRFDQRGPAVGGLASAGRTADRRSLGIDIEINHAEAARTNRLVLTCILTFGLHSRSVALARKGVESEEFCRSLTDEKVARSLGKSATTNTQQNRGIG